MCTHVPDGSSSTSLRADDGNGLERSAYASSAAMASILSTRHGSSRTPANEWPAPPSRRRMFFALERDLHQGSLRCYRLPEQPPLIREAGARNENEREAALQFTPESIDLLPARLLFERRA